MIALFIVAGGVVWASCTVRGIIAFYSDWKGRKPGVRKTDEEV